MKAILILVLFSFTPQAWSQPTLTCASATQALLNQWNSLNSWVEVAPNTPGAPVFRSPTKTTGIWIQLETRPDKSQQFRRVSASSVDTVLFQSDCQKQAHSKKNSQRGYNAQAFTDAHLEKIRLSKTPSLIYLWSPNMIYSVKKSHIFRKAAQSLKMDFVPIMDSRASEQFGRTLASAANADLPIKTNESLDLKMREATVHYPSVLVIANGKISRKPIVGVYTPELLRARLLIDLGALR